MMKLEEALLSAAAATITTTTHHHPREHNTVSGVTDAQIVRVLGVREPFTRAISDALQRAEDALLTLRKSARQTKHESYLLVHMGRIVHTAADSVSVLDDDDGDTTTNDPNQDAATVEAVEALREAARLERAYQAALAAEGLLPAATAVPALATHFPSSLSVDATATFDALADTVAVADADADVARLEAMAQVASEGQFACANTMDLTPATTLVVPPAKKARHLERLLCAHDARAVSGRPDMFGEMLARECVALLENGADNAHPYGASIGLTTPAGSWLTHRLDLSSV
jgi:hypothetical protein